MSDIVSTRASNLLRLLWIAGASVCALAMFLLPGQETIPFHLIWIGLCLMYGFTVWRPIEMVVTITITAVTTGAIMVNHAMMGWISWPEIAEVPLSVALTMVIALYLQKRHVALTELARIAENERRRAEARQLLLRQASHELRTPITVARGYTELVRQQLTDPGVIEDATIVLEELDKLAQITQRLVTLMQVDDHFDREPVDLRSELTRIVHRWAPAADRNWLVLSSDGKVPANRDRLEAALDCLLDNAVKFTGPGETISVSGAVDSRSWTVEVADAGIGMSLAATEALTQATPLPADTATGTGLGLATVRTITGAWGGVLSVLSKPGAGTTVTLRFPLATEPDDSSVINVVRQNRQP